MSIIDKIRIPYKEDNVFGILFLMCFAVPLVFSLHSYENFETIKYCFLLILTGCAGFILFKKPLLEVSVRQFNFPKTFFVIFTIFLGWTLLASLFAIDRNYAFFGFYPRFTNSFTFFLLLGALFLVLASQTKAKILVLLKVLFMSSSLIALWGLFGAFGVGYYSGLNTDVIIKGVPSFLGNPNFSSMFVASLLPFGLILAFLAKSRYAKVYYLSAVIIQICSEVVFASRGAILSLILGMIVVFATMFIFEKEKRKKIAIIFGIALFCLLAFSTFFINYARPGIIKTGLTLNETNARQRLEVWNMSWQLIKSKPLLGYGPGNFEIIFEQNRHLSSSKSNFFDDPHNIYIYLATAGGLPMLGLFLCLICYPLKQAFKQLKAQSFEDRAIIFSVAGCLVILLAAVCFNPFPVPCYLLLVLFLSFLLAETGKFEIISFTKFKYFFIVFYAIICFWGVSLFIAENFFYSAIQAYNNQEYEQANGYVKGAIFLNPTNSLYYQYLTASAIRAQKPVEEIQADLNKFRKFHASRPYTYVQTANLFYLLYFGNPTQEYKDRIMQNLNKAISLDSDNERYYFTRAQYNFVFGDMLETEKDLKKALELEPGDFDAVMLLVKIYQMTDNREQIEKYLKLAISINNVIGLPKDLLHLISDGKKLSDLPYKIYLSVGRMD